MVIFFKHALASEQKSWTDYVSVKASIDNWMGYYNHERYQWNLEKLSPTEFYHYTMTGIHPLK